MTSKKPKSEGAERVARAKWWLTVEKGGRVEFKGRGRRRPDNGDVEGKMLEKR